MIGIGGLVSQMIFMGEKPDYTVKEDELIDALRLRFDVVYADAVYFLQYAEKARVIDWSRSSGIIRFSKEYKRTRLS